MLSTDRIPGIPSKDSTSNTIEMTAPSLQNIRRLGYRSYWSTMPRFGSDAEFDPAVLYKQNVQPVKADLDELKEEMRKLETGNSGMELVKPRVALLQKKVEQATAELGFMGNEGVLALGVIAPWLDSIGREAKVLESRLASVSLARHNAFAVDEKSVEKWKSLESKVRKAQCASYERRREWEWEGEGEGEGFWGRQLKELEDLRASVNAFKSDAKAWLRALEKGLDGKYCDIRRKADPCASDISEVLLNAQMLGYDEVCQALDGLSARIADAAGVLTEKSRSGSLLRLLLSYPADGSTVPHSSQGQWLAQLDRLKPSEQSLVLSAVAKRVFNPEAMQKIGDEAQRRLDRGWSLPMLFGLVAVAMKQYLGSFGLGTTLVKNTGYPEFLLLAAFMHKVMECALVDDRVGNFNLPGGSNPCVRWSKKFLTDSVPALLFLAALCLSDWWVQSREPHQLTGWTKPEGARDMTIRLGCGMLGSTASLLASNALRQGFGGSFRYVHPSLRGVDYMHLFKIFFSGPRFFGALSRMLSLVPVVAALRMGTLEDGPYWPDFVLIGGWMFRDLPWEILEASNCFKSA